MPGSVEIGAGTVIGAYRIGDRVGEGGMGEVFLAEHRELGRLVALKVLRHERAHDLRLRERFVREAWLANRVRHDHIVDVTDLAYLPDGRPYVVMEYLEGTDLYSLWGANGLDPDRFVHVMTQVAEALAAAHRAGVIHRDLKPSNIFLIKRGGRSDYVKIMDFGLGKLTSPPEHLQFTQTGEVVATPHYMSPEQATGEPVDGRSDLYSLGVVMWELLVGRRPFNGKTFGEFVLLHATRTAPPPSQADQSMVQGGAPELLDGLVMRCLAKAPAARFASADELVRALGEARARLERARPPAPKPPRRVDARQVALAAALGVLLVAALVRWAMPSGEVTVTPVRPAMAAPTPPPAPPLIITARNPAPEPVERLAAPPTEPAASAPAAASAPPAARFDMSPPESQPELSPLRPRKVRARQPRSFEPTSRW